MQLDGKIKTAIVILCRIGNFVGVYGTIDAKLTDFGRDEFFVDVDEFEKYQDVH